VLAQIEAKHIHKFAAMSYNLASCCVGQPEIPSCNADMFHLL
jgi:hypothetical protein